MKRLLILLILISGLAVSKDAVSKDAVSKDATRELKNLHNDKYMDKYHYQNNNQSIVCESYRGQRAYCRADVRYGVNFIRQLSSSSCNYNWGYDNNGIWVINGCRAEFSVNFGWDQSGSEGNIMACESHNYQRSYCPAYLGGRDVFLLNQLSNSSCFNNWGYDRNGIWVTNGCRAEFVIEDQYGSLNDIVVCSSRDLRFQSCKADTRGGVDFIRQLSRASCNGNWGYDRQGIWVTNGCRAKFRVLPYNYSNNTYQDTVRCSSRNSRRTVCQADTSGGVRLKKQRSRATCRGNWGFTHNQIWVDNGCRATFQLYINGNNNGYGNNNRLTNNQPPGQTIGHGHGNNYGNNNHPQTSRITCASRNLNRQTCSIPAGSKVKLHKQLSRASCVGHWGFNRREIWVDNGCRAQFSVK